MVMGKVVSRSKYDYYEYVTALLISLGMVFFMLGSSDENKSIHFICLNYKFVSSNINFNYVTFLKAKLLPQYRVLFY